MSRVLVVEDEAHLAQGLRFNLEAEGHSVHITGKGEEALELLLKNKEEFDALAPWRASCARRRTTFRY